MVDRADIDGRRILHATRTRPLRLADLLSPRARRYGITVDIGAGEDYTEPQRRAAELHAHGFAGLRARARHDPTGRANNIVEFADRGPRTRVIGWKTTQMRVTEDPALLTSVARYGTGIAPVPMTVAVIRPA